MKKINKLYFILVTSLVNINFVNAEIVDAVTDDGTEVSPFAKVFIIMGALLFAKQLPKLITDLLGIDLKGEFTLNPLKKMSTVPILGKATNLALGTADSVIHRNGVRAGFKRNWTGLGDLIKGGDGKSSVFETADRKLRREVNKKRDTAQQRYEARLNRKQVDEQLALGERTAERIENMVNHDKNVKTTSAALEKAESQYGKNSKEYLDAKKANDEARSNAKVIAEEKVYGSSYYKNKKEADEYKKEMYAYENVIQAKRAAYESAVSRGASKEEQSRLYNEYEEVVKNAGTAKKAYEKANERHELDKKLNSRKAEMEDAVDIHEKIGGGKPIPKASSYSNYYNDPNMNNNGGPSNNIGPNNYGGPTDNIGPNNYGGPSNNIGPNNYGGPSSYSESSNNDSNSTVDEKKRKLEELREQQREQQKKVAASEQALSMERGIISTDGGSTYRRKVFELDKAQTEEKRIQEEIDILEKEISGSSSSSSEDETSSTIDDNLSRKEELEREINKKNDTLNSMQQDLENIDKEYASVNNKYMNKKNNASFKNEKEMEDMERTRRKLMDDHEELIYEIDLLRDEIEKLQNDLANM